MEEHKTPSRMFHKAGYKLFQYAAHNREHPTEAEEKLWNILKNKQLEGYKFRRQHPIGRFILDFYCHAERLAIEIDGDYHQKITQIDYDDFRTASIEALTDITLIRFSNDEVLHDIENVKQKIIESINIKRKDNRPFHI